MKLFHTYFKHYFFCLLYIFSQRFIFSNWPLLLFIKLNPFVTFWRSSVLMIVLTVICLERRNLLFLNLAIYLLMQKLRVIYLPAASFCKCFKLYWIFLLMNRFRMLRSTRWRTRFLKKLAIFIYRAWSVQLRNKEARYWVIKAFCRVCFKSLRSSTARFLWRYYSFFLNLYYAESSVILCIMLFILDSSKCFFFYMISLSLIW